MNLPLLTDTIVAPATPPGHSALAVVRLCGDQAYAIADSLFKGKKLSEQSPNTIHFGTLNDEAGMIDEVVASLFRKPHSYTGEDIIEFSTHGSPYVVKRMMQACMTAGARIAEPGEFTRRAFVHGKLDLSQAEAVADLIASENQSQHTLAIQQMRGAYSSKIEGLRQELIDFAALLELELDFSEEDIAFADREQLFRLLNQAEEEIQKLSHSFQIGNVMKKGIPVAIVGKPNSGKSTLLNILLQEEKAIVSEVAGTTRDFIEDTLQLGGITYRFIDTAGLRQTDDALEAKGIERSYEKMKQARLILFIADIQQPWKEIVADVQQLTLHSDQKLIVVLNKADAIASTCDVYDVEEAIATSLRNPVLICSAKQGMHIDKLLALIEQETRLQTGFDVLISNERHWQALQEAASALVLVREGLNEHRSGEFVALDLRMALQALGRITGKISSEDILGSVFSRFCIGK
ncbi:MAG TPA: tRNA uridine-5-carboxymethylaminomethyl(34) synthesis GTPase MnmE [Chitinophagaceae bacterium]|nr:tRNA uridine-5-carboxymethylaminomethyl(34) synthesis GTPase MnmE [Chitinophagaceae bacterium]